MPPSESHGTWQNGYSHANRATANEPTTHASSNGQPINGSSNTYVNGTNGFTDAHLNGKNGFTEPSDFAISASSGANVNGTNRFSGAHANGTNGSSSPRIKSNGFSNTDIAICGIGVRLPGGIRSPSDLFDFLVNKGDARSVVPEDRYNVEAFFGPSDKPGTLMTKYGYYLDLDLSRFDASMFRMSNAEIATVDPSQRLLLEVTREAFESAGEADFRGRNIGTFVGNFTEDWQDLQNVDLLNFAPYQMIGKSDFALSNRLAYEYDLLGPSVSVKTACSATAQAVHAAILAIHNRSCPSAIVAGANVIITPRTSISMSALGLLAPDGNCKTFDADANGFARGESVCAMYLKPLQDAIRDGNPIRAVIRACDSNADGGDGSRTFGTPNAVAQEALIRQTYASAGLNLADTKVVELHGTGTVVGDPLETAAIARCFGGDEKVYIGSVKPNLGHGEGGSALTSILKTVVALENKTILPNIKFEKPNPKIRWDRNLHVPVDPLPWPEQTCERISINSFGLGGSNVHMVLDSADSMGLPSKRRRRTMDDHLAMNGHGSNTTPKRKSLLLLSGNSIPAITELAAKYAQYLEKNPGNLDAMVYTLAMRRERLKLGSYCIADDLKVGAPVIPASSQAICQVAFVFTGQGAQWTGMGRDMMLENDEFAASIRHMDEILRSIEFPPSWTLEELLLADGVDKDLLNPTDRSQPICAALQIAYVDALAALNIRPSAVVGHSSGEVASAYAAGVLTRREAIIAAYYRGYACARCKTSGSMAAVGMGRDKVEQHLKPGVVLACENSNVSVTISGDRTAVEETMDSLKHLYPDVFIRQLRVPIAYHSHHTASVGNLYKSLVEPHLVSKRPQIPFYSTVYGRQVRESKALDARYWQLNIEHPVLFRTAVTQMLADMPNTAHLEIGPHSALAGPLRQIYKENSLSASYASLCERREDATRAFLAAIGNLFCFGLNIEMPKSKDAYTLPDLPTYPWNYASSFWSETRMMAGWRFMKHRKHELLGQIVLESSDVEPAWRNFIRIGDVSWLADHCVEKDIVFPAAGYIAIAGTAVSQLMGSTDYTVQHVNIASALLLDESKGIEIVTTLRKHSLTTSNDSKWWEFSIASENKSTWTKHCWGLVTHGCAVARSNTSEVVPLARKVDSKRWYQTLSRTGLNYSNRFVGLENITASPVDTSASASILDRQDPDENYTLHPSTIDIVLQSWSVAATRGEYRKLDKMFLPTFIDQFYIGTSGTQKMLRLHTTAHESVVSALGDSYGVSNDNDLAFVLNGFHGTRMHGSIKQERPEPNAWSTQWHPSFDFAPPERLIHPTGYMTSSFILLEQFSLLCEVEIQEVAATVTSLAQPFFKHFLAGVAKHLNQPSRIPDAEELKSFDREARLKKMAEWRELSKSGPVKSGIETLWRTADNIKDVLEGRENFLDLLLADQTLQNVYNEYNSWSDNSDFFRVLGLNKPQLRILEIGAGTGSLTAVALEALHTSDRERLYGEYTITDVSAGFVNQTKERFSQYQNLKYHVCDISADPLKQGFEAGAYDFIIASNVLHATPKLNETLTNCRTLLKPNGQLYMQEVGSGVRYPGLIFGLFEGWWSGIEDGRVESPTITEEEWDVRLRQCGFHGIHSSVRDNKDPDLFTISNIVARAKSSDTSTSEERKVTLLKPSAELGHFGHGVKSALEAAGHTVDEYVWGAKPPDGQDIVSLIDVDGSAPLLADLNAEDLASFIDILGDASGSAVLWLMRSAQTECSDPQNGKILGVARCIRGELALDFVTLELNELDKEATHAAARLLSVVHQAQETATDSDDSIDIESEYVWRKGQMLVSRMHTLSADKALAETVPQPQGKHLTIGQPGMLQSMCWTGHMLPPLAAGEVQVRITVAALNFHDVAEAIGIMDPEGHADSDGYHGLGCEATAIVTAVGDDVKHVSVGERVIFMEMITGVFATEVQVPAGLVVQAPENVSDEEAAGLIIPYATVLWSFLEKAHVKPGQRLLIQSAAGGVGIAAIHVARWLGLDFYCTVGSKDKVDWLNTELGVPRDRIFHSRDDSFVADIMRVTDGAGVDIVLNSLSGELLHASWKCVAEEGSMIDLGKRDFLGRGRLAMRPFADNRAFFGIDMAALGTYRKPKVRPMLELMTKLLQEGKIFPLRPTTAFEADKIQDAFRYMQKGIHWGRVVVKMPADPNDLPMTLPSLKPIFNRDAVYLLSGGMGGLGRSTLSWMVDHGARHLVVLSPSAGTKEEHRQFVNELHERGCKLHCFAGDVADVNAVRKVVTAVEESGRHIKGVLQLAMVLRDTGFLNMDHNSWTVVNNPKVQGTMNLHELLPKDLDFFVMFGSTSGTLGAYGQSNYAAANAFLDSFTHFRHGLGLPAAVLDIAAVADVGYVASTKDVAELLHRSVSRFMSEGELLQGLHLTIARSSTQYIAPSAPTSTVVYQDAAQIILYNETSRTLSDPLNTTAWRRDPRLSVFRNNQDAISEDTGTSSGALRSFMGSLVHEPEKLNAATTATFMAQEIAKRIFSFLMIEHVKIDTSHTLNSMGADSLVAIEIRNWWKQALGIEITVLELADKSKTLEMLGALAVERLRKKFLGE